MGCFRHCIGSDRGKALKNSQKCVIFHKAVHEIDTGVPIPHPNHAVYHIKIFIYPQELMKMTQIYLQFIRNFHEKTPLIGLQRKKMADSLGQTFGPQRFYVGKYAQVCTEI
ncbi:unknown [Clostridium sp. CAG:149]|nr:unknown [Clostridium sp. CAG:149]